MRTTICIVLFIVWCFITAETKISFKPFSISFNSPFLLLAWLLMVAGMVCFSVHFDKKAIKEVTDKVVDVTYPKAYKKGYIDAIEDVRCAAKK